MRGGADGDKLTLMEMVLLIGVQGSGKSSFYKDRFYRTHLRISRDMLKSPSRERRILQVCLDTRQPVAIDNMNLTRQGRADYLRLAHTAGFRAVGYFFQTSVAESLQRNAQRTGPEKIAKPGIFAAHKRLEPPEKTEGFAQLFIVRIDVMGQFLIEEPALVPGAA